MRDFSFNVVDNSLQLIDNSSIPDVLQDSFRYLFLLNDPDMRRFESSGIYGLLTEITDGALTYVNVTLADIAKTLQKKLQPKYKNITSLTIVARGENSKLTVELTITTNSETLKQILYEV